MRFEFAPNDGQGRIPGTSTRSIPTHLPMKTAERLRPALFLTLPLVLLAACAAPTKTPDTLILSIFGTNDVHGELLASADRGGLVTTSGYINALRAARAADGGAVLVIDAGDMWQGTLESNLAEGAPVVAAFNAIGVTAAAIGNHEFDFGPAGDRAIPMSRGDDPRGALKARAREAEFPLLAANLIDDVTGRPVEWPNVQPSVIVESAGVRVGIVGVTASNSLQTTIAANTVGLSLAPLAATIEREATALRSSGATVVIVAAHAGGICRAFEDPDDLSSCDLGHEIFEVAASLPPGLVDHIVAGHVHQGIAHIVNGISITSSYASTRAFSRTDLVVERKSGRVVDRQVHAPHPATAETGATYESHAIVPDPVVSQVAATAATDAEAMKARRLGVVLEAPFPIERDVEAPLFNLMTGALLDEIDADVAIHNVFGGIRKGLPEGELTFGAVYEMFPFDNIVAVLDLSGHELREIIATQAHRRARLAGIAGMRVWVDCTAGPMNVVMRYDDGREINDADRVRVIANDFLALGGDDILTPAIPPGGFVLRDDMPRTRDALVDWFENAGDSLDPAQFATSGAPRWNLPDIIPATCLL